MKKCPKCGTILDESKQQCYMCGADLDEEEQSFEESFSSQLGNNVKQEVDETAIVDNSVSFSTSNAYDQEMNKLNSMDFDERSGLQKNIDNIFKTEEGFKNKDSLIAEKKALEEQRQKALEEQENLKKQKIDAKQQKKQAEKEKTNKIKADKELKKQEQKMLAKQQREMAKNANNKFLPADTNFPTFAEDEEYINTFSGFNKKNTSKVERKEYFSKPKKKKINLAPLFNFICVVAVLVGIYFVYIKFIKDDNKSNALGGLKYVMPDDFKLESSDGSNRYYTYGQSCSVRISYGATSLGDTFVDNYIASQKEAFENEEGAQTSYEEMILNDNTWKSLNILYFVDDEESDAGFKTFIKYKYTSIFFNGNFYHVVFVNAKGNDECLSVYNDFVKTLEFE